MRADDDGEPLGGPHDAAETESAAEADLSAEIRRRRREIGLSQGELSLRVGFSREYVSRAERCGRGLASENLVLALDRALEAGGELVRMREQAAAARQRRRDGLPTPMSAIRVADGDLGGGSPGPLSSSALVSLVDVLSEGEALTVLDDLVESVVGRYELEGPRLLWGEVRALQTLSVQVAGRFGRGGRVSLARGCARQSALLAYMSVNLGRFADADSYALEAWAFATAAKDRDLLAWIKGTQSFAAYYQGRYPDALRLAQVGVRIAGDGPHRIRLLCNGVARAAARMGHVATMDQALEDALSLVGRPGPADVMPSCVSFAPYGSARTIANAATAFLAAGRHGRVLELTTALDETLRRSDSDWSRTLVRLDMASALSRGPDRDPGAAAAVGIDALRIVRANPIASISERAAELAADLTGSGDRRAAEEFGDALRGWRTAPAGSGV
ncbi:helix-turn-helix domain-containing protein [Pseudonocardia sp.]|uniref:helix-turn-helix domain-containing protein n=1 Tax=Pseudonocardia sp. TaxID=60912 RepID=UPI003D0C726B